MTVVAPERLQRADGALSLRFDAAGRQDAGNVTRLADLYQRDPCRALLPEPDPGEPRTAVLITTAGGLTGGDRLDIKIAVEAGATALCTPQAAEKIYRSPGDAAIIDIALTVAAEAALEWLPQEMILFDGARLKRSVTLDLQGNARLLAGDITVFGRTARGERFTAGELSDRWQLRRDGRLHWTDATRLTDDIAARLDHPAGFDGAVAQALILYRGPEPAAARDRLRALLEVEGGEGADRTVAGATLLDDLLLLRLLDRDAARLRRCFARLWAALRPGLGQPDRMPRLWRL
jgi:urease accessory protein